MTETRSMHPLRWLVVGLCGLALVFDGYDLVVYGTTVAALRREWGITGAEAGFIASLSLVGMLVGALGIGTLTDLLGRRRTLIGAVVLFSAAMPLCALAQGPGTFAALRLVAGLGLGGVMPIASALVTEYAPPGRRNLTYVLMQSGYAVGGVLAASLALAVVPEHGWRPMYVVGGLPLLLFLPVALRLLPESVEYLAARGRTEEAAQLAARLGMQVPAPAEAAEEQRGGIGVLFSRPFVVPTLLFWAMTFCALLLIYGLSTWLPDIMREQGYPLGSALSFLLAFNLGSIAGSAMGGLAADRFGSVPVIATTFALGGLAILGLASDPGRFGLYLLCAVGGYGTIGAQNLINPFVTRAYPQHARATGVGWSLGIGRLGAILGPAVGGLVLDSDLGPDWNFYLFASVAGLGLLATLGLLLTGVVRRPRPTPDLAPAVPAAG